MTCPNKNYKFYQDLLKGFRTKYPQLSEEELNSKAFDVWYRTEQQSFRDWYGSGNRTVFGEPELNKDFDFVNWEGKKVSMFDLKNDKRFDEQEKVDAITESLNKQTSNYDALGLRIIDALITSRGALNQVKEERAKAKKLEIQELIDRLGENRGKARLALFAKNAINAVNLAYNKYLDAQEKGTLDVRTLRIANGHIQMYDYLDEIIDTLRDYKDSFTDIDMKALNEAVTQKNYIKRNYVKNLEPLIAKELAQYSYFNNEVEILRQLKNAPFDVSSITSFWDYIGDSADAVLPLVAKQFDKARRMNIEQHIPFRHTLVTLAQALEKAKGNPSRSETLFGDMLEADINGKRTGYIISEYRLGEFHAERQKLIDAMHAIENINSPEYIKAREEYRTWLKNNTVQRYLPYVQNVFNSLSVEAREARDVFKTAIEQLQDGYKKLTKLPDGSEAYIYDFSEMPEEDFERIQELQLQITKLKNLFDEDGNHKSGIELKIAQDLRKYAKDISELYHVVAVAREQFNKSRKEAEAKGQDALDKWLIKNTRRKFQPAFWERFNQLMTIITGGEKSEITEEINSILAEYKDQDGVVNGDLIPEPILKRLIELYEDRKIITQGNRDEGRTKSQIAAALELKSLVKYINTEYYDRVFAEKKALSEAEFQDWYNKNHTEDATGTMRPLGIWTTMLPRDEAYIEEEAPNHRWEVSKIKDEFLNKDFKQDENGYALPVSKWKNAQYNKLLNAAKEIKDYYDFFVKSMKEANSKLPDGFGIGYRLPGIRRSDIQRIIDGGAENALSAVKQGIKDRFVNRVGDTDFGQVVDEQGRIVNYIPVHFTSKIEPEDQSYDLTTLLNSFMYMAMNYDNMAKVIDVIEGAKDLVGARDVIQTDSGGKALLNKARGLTNKTVTKLGITSKAYEQLDKYIKMMVYQQTNDSLGFIDILGAKVDKVKLLNQISGYTSYSLLGLNALAGTVNILQGESSNWVEAAAGQHFTKKAYAWALKEYSRNTMGIIGDIGARIVHNKVNALAEYLDFLGDYKKTNTGQVENARWKRLMRTDSVFFLMHIGEHSIQNHVALAMMKDFVPLDKDGNKIEGLNNLYDAYSIKDGVLTLDPRVANFGEKERLRFSEEVQGVIRGLHGNYGEHTAAMWQADARWRLVGAMRKWIMPGVKRRWWKKANNEMRGVVTEGMYITTGRFLGRLIKDLKQLKFDLMSEEWKNLSDMEKKNIQRTIMEIGVFLTAVVGSQLLYALAGGDDKDKRKDNMALYFFAYQAYRLRQELTFYINPLSAYNVLRSPAASMSVLEAIIRMIGQLGDPSAKYTQGDRKGQLKIRKKVEDVLPFYKQYHRAFDADGLEDQFSMLLNKQGISAKQSK